MKNPILKWRPTRYVLVGAICATLYNLTMIVGDWAGASYIATSILAVAIVAPTGYLLHATFTFGGALSWRAFLRFAATILAGFPISLLAVALFSAGLRFPMIVSAPLATIVLVMWNYATAHWAIIGRFGFR